MARIVNNTIIDQRLENKNIIRLEEYKGIDIKIKWKCLIDGHEWETTPYNLFRTNGTKCPRCSNKALLNNAIIDERISTKGIIRLSNFINVKTKMKFKCITCGFEWESTPNTINKAIGCVECHRGGRLNNTIIDERLYNTNIIRLDDYTHSNIKMRWKCLVCDYEWTCSPVSIIHKRSGCHECSNKKPVTDEYIDILLESKTYKRISEYTSGKVRVKCSIDGYEWDTTVGSITRGQGCSKCANCVPLTDKEIDLRILQRNIIRLEESNGCNYKIKFKCLLDDYEWYATPSSIISGKGCARCSKKEKVTNESIDAKLANTKVQRIGDYVSHDKKVKFKCLIDGHEWEALPSGVVYGRKGCPVCRKVNEFRIYNFLKDRYGVDNVEYQKTIRDDILNRNYFIDYVVNGIFIEYNGGQHYFPIKWFGGESAFIKQQKRDNDLRDYCTMNNIRLIEIPYWLSHNEQYKLVEDLML